MAELTRLRVPVLKREERWIQYTAALSPSAKGTLQSCLVLYGGAEFSHWPFFIVPKLKSLECIKMSDGTNLYFSDALCRQQKDDAHAKAEEPCGKKAREDLIGWELEPEGRQLLLFHRRAVWQSGLAVLGFPLHSGPAGDPHILLRHLWHYCSKLTPLNVKNYVTLPLIMP